MTPDHLSYLIGLLCGVVGFSPLMYTLGHYAGRRPPHCSARSSMGRECALPKDHPGHHAHGNMTWQNFCSRFGCDYYLGHPGEHREGPHL